jgi:hypothetical protein
MRRDIPVFLLIGALFIATGLFDPYSTERPYTGENPDDVPPGHLTLEERLGYAILQRAGYGETKLVGPGAESDSSETTTGEVTVGFAETSHADLACLGDIPAKKAADGGIVSVRNLAVAVLAAERYNRSGLTSWAESRYADVVSRVSGRIPDVSLGVAQIRPATARRALYRELGQFELPDRDLLQLLLNDCQNARLAGAYLGGLVDSIAPTLDADETVERAAMAYNGAVTGKSPHAVTYVQAVKGAYGILQRSSESGENADPETGAPASPPAVERLCASFSVGAGAGRGPLLASAGEGGEGGEADSAGASAATRHRAARVTGFVRQYDPGPASYLEALFERRRAWLEHELTAAGYSRERVQIRAGLPGEPVPEECRSGGRSSIAVIEVPLADTATPSPAHGTPVR